MPEDPSLGELRRRLTQQGFPPSYVERTIRELADHRADIEEEASALGLTGTPAAEWVSRQLGSPDTLLTGFTSALPRPHWPELHPFLSFCVLPILLLPVSFFLLGAILLKLLGGDNLPAPSILTQVWIPTLAHGLNYAVITLFSTLLCWLALRSCRRWRWAAASTAILSLHGLVHFIEVLPPQSGLRGSVMWGYGITPDLSQWNFTAIAIPLLILALCYGCARIRAHAPRGKGQENAT